MASAILGSCVVFPEPVAPATMMTGCASMATAMSFTRSEMGSSGGNWMGESLTFRIQDLLTRGIVRQRDRSGAGRT